MVLFCCLTNRLPAQYKFSGPVDQVFAKAHQDSKLDRFSVVNFKDFKVLRSNKLKEAVHQLNEELKLAGQVFVKRERKKNPQKLIQAYGYVRVEVVQPGDDYREAKLKILVSDDYKIQDPTKGLHPDAVKSFEFETRNFDKVQIMNYADHKTMTGEVLYPKNDNYIPPDEQFYAPIGSANEQRSSPLLAPEFPDLYLGLPYFNQEG